MQLDGPSRNGRNRLLPELSLRAAATEECPSSHRAGRQLEASAPQASLL